MKKSLISQVMSQLAKIKSPARAEAARRNGAKGGRPRKVLAGDPALTATKGAATSET